MKGNRLLTLATMAVLVSLMAVVDVSTKALAPQLGRVKRATAGWSRRLCAFRAWRGVGASMATALLLCGMFPIAGGALSESQHAGAFLISESASLRSRDQVTVLSGQNLKAGAVVGCVTIGVGRANIPAVVGTGNGLMSALFAGPEVEKGAYLVKCITAAADGGTFSVTTPGGKLLPNAVVGTAYRSRHINFSIADGATDFIVNDLFTITVETGAPTVVGTGNGTISGLSLGPDAKTGQYLVECITAVTNGGTFKVVSPDGDTAAVGSIVAGAGGTLVLADQRQLNLTITDGSTDFAVGDTFQVFAFNELTKKAVAWDPLTFDGRHKVAGVLWADTDATSADKLGTIINADAEVRGSDLVYAAAITASQKDSAARDLKALGVKVRS